MNYETVDAKLKDLKSKAQAARKNGNRAMAASFAAGAKRVQRKLRSIPKPVPAEASADETESAE